MNVQSPGNRQEPRNGFALIATVSVMVLLVMIALAMLSLSTIEVRQLRQQSHQQIARANARLALMIALGELQKHAGPDQRVTATADLLGDGVADRKKHWTTVWDTSEWNVKDPVKSRDEEAYRVTLVSRKNVESLMSRAELTADVSAAVPDSDDSWVSLVGNGSVKQASDYVYVQKVRVRDEVSQGSYAYWVGDEGVKARYDIHVPDDFPGNTWAKAGRMGQAGGTGIHRMTGMNQYRGYLSGGGEELMKMLDYATLDLGLTDPGSHKQHFHNITTSHLGLLVDNRWGGIRRDLSTAFELDANDFGGISEFNASGESNQTDAYRQYIPNDVTTNPIYYSEETDPYLGYLYEVPVDSSRRYRGPTWDVLRNHYRIYKKEWNDLNFRGTESSGSDVMIAHGVVPFSYNRDPNNSGVPNASLGSWYSGPSFSGGGGYQCPFVSRHGKGGGYSGKNGARTQPTMQKITPHLLRTILVYGLAKEQDRFFLTIDPYFVIHNPYNQPLEFYSLGMDLNWMNEMVEFNVNYKEAGSGAAKSTVFRVQEGAQTGLQSYRLNKSSVGNHRLEPGEIKVISVEVGRHKLKGNSRVIRLTSFQYNEGAGVYLGDVGKTMNVAPGSVLKVEAKTKRPNWVPSIFTRLLHPLKATGGVFELENEDTFSSFGNRNHDWEPVCLIQQMRIIANNQTLSGTDSRAANVGQIPHPEDGSFYLYALDISMKDFSGDVAVMGDFNPRCMAVDTRDYDAADEIAPNWELELKPSDLLSLQFVNANSNGFWGEGKTQVSGGSPKVVLFDLPRKPISSLAALQHADTSKLNFHAMRSIGNSRMQVGQLDAGEIYNRLGQTRSSTVPKFQIDTSWAANEVLWDRYYFSGMNWGQHSGQTFSTQDTACRALLDGEIHRVCVNPRMALIRKPHDNKVDELRDYRKLGKYLGIKGAFNVNSTSVEAWKAVLSSLSGREISYLSGVRLRDKKIDHKESPMSRFTTPAGWDDDDYSGFRSLDEKELESIAEEIVEQVKLRGPFMGLSDFVNRRLISGASGKVGALQAAIDRSGVNRSVKIGSTRGNRLKQSSPDANEGMARHLNQGDILTQLAPIMATRSDTFLVRTYGESLDASGTVRARAWCEALVQRTPEWVYDTDEPVTVKHRHYPEGNSTDDPVLRQWEANPDLPEACRKFGRKFIIRSFRWLSPEEI